MNINLNDDVRVDGQQSDEGSRLLGEQQMDSVEDVEHLILFAAVQPVDDHDQAGLLAAERVQTGHHLDQDCHLSLQLLQIAFGFDRVDAGHAPLQLAALRHGQRLHDAAPRVQIGHHHHAQDDGDGDQDDASVFPSPAVQSTEATRKLRLDEIEIRQLKLTALFRPDRQCGRG